MTKQLYIVFGFFSILFYMGGGCHPIRTTDDQNPVTPSGQELNRPFGKHDEEAFRSPSQIHRPETYLFYIGENVSAEGITADLEAIAGAGIAGVLFLHGQLGGAWPGAPQLPFLTPAWEKIVQHTAEECRRLGLRFSMHNCPGWALSGGPWIKPSDAMRQLVWSRTDVAGSTSVNLVLTHPMANRQPWRDYRDITTLAFPTPLDDYREPLKPQSLKSNHSELPWKDCMEGNQGGKIFLPPATEENPHWVEVTFPGVTVIRTIEFSSITGMNWDWCYEPDVTITVEAVLQDGTTRKALCAVFPRSNFQDEQPFSLACSEIPDTQTYRIYLTNKHNMTLHSLRLFSAARKNNWEAEAGWTLRSKVCGSDNPQQSQAAFVDFSQILDISQMMDEQGNLTWDAPPGQWTILRIGHVNSGVRNAPAPREGVGWECNKLSETGADTHFSGYIGRLISENGPLAGGLLNSMHIDSWECKYQTWTTDMEAEFERISGYPLRKWIPAIFGYVVGDHDKSSRFLRDWRAAISDLFTNKFYGRMAKLAKDNHLKVSWETSAGDVFPADFLAYYKYADVPMCEFWYPYSEGYLGSMNFRSIKPTASAARLYGKPRVAAEAFTTFDLTWDEHLNMLKEVANINFIEGVTHLVFHAYTHNPQTTDFLPPGTSFGFKIGTPFLRGQTWWRHMPEITTYFARCNYLLERGRPVSDVLWYIGDEINHKPDQDFPFPAGFKYDYCNPDVLLNRLSVRDGMLVTPEGICYRVLWLPDNPRMIPQTLEKLYSLIREGATVVGDAPQGLATLSDTITAQHRFDTVVKDIWGETPQRGIRKLGKGVIVSGMTIDDALNELKIESDVIGGDVLWSHRRIDGADWYYVCTPKGRDPKTSIDITSTVTGYNVCAPKGGGFQGTLDFRNNKGFAEIWDPVTGKISPAKTGRNGNRTLVTLELPQAGSCFVVFRKKGGTSQNAKNAEQKMTSYSISFTTPWTLSFPEGWGAPSSLRITELKAWKDLEVTDEAKAFSGACTYTTTFDAGQIKQGKHFLLYLGRVEMIAEVSLNEKKIRTLWTPPYHIDLTEAIRSGSNTLTIEVTGTWFNRLVYDAGRPEIERKTWTISGPAKDERLRESGLLGPVTLIVQENI